MTLKGSEFRPLQGLCNLSNWAPCEKMEAAKEWYTQFLGIEPYFERSDDKGLAYVEWRIGENEDELSLTAWRYLPTGSPEGFGGAVAYWSVDSVPDAADKLLGLGARIYQPLVEREAGFVTASLVDPYGNIIGLMESPHYRDKNSKEKASGA